MTRLRSRPILHLLAVTLTVLCTALRQFMVLYMLWAEFYFCHSFKLWRKIYAFGRCRPSPLKKFQRGKYMTMTHDCSGLKIRFLIKIAIYLQRSLMDFWEEVGHFCKSSSSLNSQSEDIKVGYCYKWARWTQFATGNLGRVTWSPDFSEVLRFF